MCRSCGPCNELFSAYDGNHCISSLMHVVFSACFAWLQQHGCFTVKTRDATCIGKVSAKAYVSAPAPASSWARCCTQCFETPWWTPSQPCQRYVLFIYHNCCPYACTSYPTLTIRLESCASGKGALSWTRCAIIPSSPGQRDLGC